MNTEVRLGSWEHQHEAVLHILTTTFLSFLALKWDRVNWHLRESEKGLNPGIISSSSSNWDFRKYTAFDKCYIFDKSKINT